MPVTEEQLRCFQAAAKTLNFTKAAKLCFVTQPAFSRTIAALEAEWGIPLFERSTRKIRLTREGEECLKKADRVLKAFDSLNDTVSHIRQTVYGSLHIGFNNLSGPPPWFVAALKTFRKEYPEINLTVEQMPSHQSIHRVRNGELDCALVYEYSAKELEELLSKRLVRTFRYAIIRKDNPLAKQEQIALKDLSGHALIFMKELEKHTYQRFQASCQHLEISIREEIFVGSIVEMGLQVELSGGIGITGFIAPSRFGDSVKAIPIQELNEPEEASYVALTWNRENRNPAIQWIRELLEQAILDERDETE